MKCLLFLLFAPLLLLSCTDDSTSEYTREHAFLRFSPVTLAPTLYTALNNPGQWCTITFTATHYVFQAAEGGEPKPVPRTALDAYGRPQYIAGFIVGTPSVPNLNGELRPVVYDLVCPNCYESAAIQRSLAFTSRERLSCRRCGRTYDLTIAAAVIEGAAGRPLLQYYFQYDATRDLLLIQN